MCRYDTRPKYIACESIQIQIHIVFVFDQQIIYIVLLAQFPICAVILQDGFHGAPGIVQPLFNHAGITLDIRKMRPNIPLTHNKAHIPDVGKVGFFKILLPIKGNVTSFHNQILIVFNGGFYHFTHNGPEIGG